MGKETCQYCGRNPSGTWSLKNEEVLELTDLKLKAIQAQDNRTQAENDRLKERITVAKSNIDSCGKHDLENNGLCKNHLERVINALDQAIGGSDG